MLCVVVGLIVGGSVGFLIEWFGPSNKLIEYPIESTGFPHNETESSLKCSSRDRSSQSGIAALSQVIGTSTTQSYVNPVDDQHRSTQADEPLHHGYTNVEVRYEQSARD